MFIAYNSVEEASREAFKSNSHCVVAEDIEGMYYVFTMREWYTMYGTDRTFPHLRVLKGYKLMVYC